MIDRVPRKFRRITFWVFVAGIFALTHFPRLEVRIDDIPRPDLFAHFAVFGCWTILLYCSELAGPLRSFRTIGRTWVFASLYACLDEALQLPEFVHRHAAWDDLAANIGGVTLGSLILTAAVFAARPRSDSSLPSS